MTHALHPLQAILVAGSLPLFLGALFSDIAYANSFEVQWKNFASWLLVGGLTTSLIAAIWAIVDLARLPRDRGWHRVFYVATLIVVWILGLVNSLVHAADAWASMPRGLVLSAIVALLSATTVWLAFSNYRVRVLT